MTNIQDVYGHLKTLTKKWFYDKTEVDNKLSNKESTSNKTAQWSNNPDDNKYPSEKLVKDSLNTKLNISDAFSGSYNDLTNIPSAFTPSSHTHGHISNDGKISQGRTQTSYINNVPIIADASSKELYYGFIATARSIEPNALAFIGTSANEYQTNINSAIDNTMDLLNTELSTRGLIYDDIYWDYNDEGFVNGIKLVPKANDDTGAITFKLKG